MKRHATTFLSAQLICAITALLLAYAGYDPLWPVLLVLASAIFAALFWLTFYA